MSESDIDTKEMQKFGITEIPYEAVEVKITDEDFNRWDALLAQQSDQYRVNPQDKLALMVGRFQPPHKGHAFVMYAALKMMQETDGKLVIVLGDPKNSPKPGSEEDMRHPLPVEERTSLLLEIAKKLGDKLQIKDVEGMIGFVRMKDLRDSRDLSNTDAAWGREVTGRVESSFGNIDVVFANDGEAQGRVQGIFKNIIGKRTIALNDLDRGENKGTLLRKLIPFGQGGRNVITGKPGTSGSRR